MLSKHKRLLIIVLIALLLLFVVKAYYDTNSIEIRGYQIENSSLGKVLNGLKVAHLSDLHIKSIGLRENKIVGILKEEKPDLIFITGDSISFEGPYEPFMSFLHELKTPLGVYAVLGNADYSNENGSCILCHKERSKGLKEKENPVFLRNSLVHLRIDGRILNIVGVDDPVKKKSDLKSSLREMNPKGPVILLAHSPEIFEEASGCNIDFLLCGHTHGGQVFATKFLRKIFPFDSSLEFLEGFFQKGKALMYVSRGIGTSYLPFRFGVKPEISFFKFSNNGSNSMNPSNPSSPINSSNPLLISNTPPAVIFFGMSLASFLETFNLFGSFRTLFDHRVPGNSNVLFDFESEEELKRLRWECHKWFELSQENATSGKYSLKVSLPPGQYPGIDFQEIQKDWSKFNYLKMDIFNPSREEFGFHVRIDDDQSGWAYTNRFDIDFKLKRGMNPISIPADSIRTNLHHRPLDLKRIKRMMVFLPNNHQQRELYIDNIRLE